MFVLTSLALRRLASPRLTSAAAAEAEATIDDVL